MDESKDSETRKRKFRKTVEELEDSFSLGRISINRTKGTIFERNPRTPKRVMHHYAIRAEINPPSMEEKASSFCCPILCGEGYN